MDARNPDLSRPRLLAETGLLVGIVWLPLALGARLTEPGPFLGAGTQIYYLLAVLAPTALIHYVVWRNGESFCHLAWRPVRPFREIFWTAAIYAAAWVVAFIDDAAFGPYSGSSAAGDLGKPGLLLTLDLLVAAIFEETFYRGYLWNRFRRLTRSPALTLLATSVFFTAAHPYPLRDLSFVFFFGLLLGLFRLQGRSQVRLILAHGAFNLVLTANA